MKVNKVKTSIMMKDRYVKYRNDNGTFMPTDEFANLIYDKDEKFRKRIITFINDAIGLEWATRFAPYTDEIHDVYVYCDSQQEYDIIVQIVKERITDTILNFYYKGDISNIENLW